MEQLLAMGFSEAQCSRALSESGNNVVAAVNFIMINIDKGDDFWAATAAVPASAGLNTSAIQAALAQMSPPAPAGNLSPSQSAASLAASGLLTQPASSPVALTADSIQAALHNMTASTAIASAAPQQSNLHALQGTASSSAPFDPQAMAVAMRSLSNMGPMLSAGSRSGSAEGTPRTATNKRPRTVDRFESDTVAALSAVFEVSLAGDNVGTQDVERAVERALAQPDNGSEYLAQCFGRLSSGQFDAVNEIETARELVLFLAREQFLKQAQQATLSRRNVAREPSTELISQDDRSLCSLPSKFFDAVLDSFEPELAMSAFVPILQNLALTIQRLKLDDGEAIDQSMQLIDMFSKHIGLCGVFTGQLENEVLRAKSWRAIEFEMRSVGGLLAISPFSLAPGLFTRDGYISDEMATQPGRPSELVTLAQIRLRDARKLLSNFLLAMFKKKETPSKPETMNANGAKTREIVLKWIAAFMAASTQARGPPRRLTPGRPNKPRNAAQPGIATNICAILLDWCAPFLADSARSQKIILDFERLDPVWCTQADRVEYDREPTLGAAALTSGSAVDALNGSMGAFERDAADEEADLAAAMEASIRSEEARVIESEGSVLSMYTNEQTAGPQYSSHFVSDTFWLTIRAIALGAVPAMHEYEAYREQLSRFAEEQRSSPSGETHEQVKRCAAMLNIISILVHTPEFIGSLLKFYALVARLVGHLVEQGRAGLMPEHVLTDLSFTVLHLFRCVPAEVAQFTAEIRQMLEMVSVLLQRSDICRAPLVRLSLANIISDAIRMDVGDDGMSTYGQSGIVTQVDEMFSGGGTDCARLAHGLMVLYHDLGYVEDTRGEVFDKNGARAQVASVLERQWKSCTPGTAAATVAYEPGTKTVSDACAHFCDDLVSENIFVFQDAMGRLADVKALQSEMENQIVWARQDDETKTERESHYRGLERTAKGFLSLAKKALKLLLLFGSEPEMRRGGFRRTYESAEKLGVVFVDFLERLVGSKARDMKVKNMEKYGFEPRELLGQVGSLLVLFGGPASGDDMGDAGFQAGLVADGLEAGIKILSKTRRVLATKCVGIDGDVVPGFDWLVARLSSCKEAAAGDSGDAAGQHMEAEREPAAEVNFDDPEMQKAYISEMASLISDEVEMGTESVQTTSHYYRQNIADSPLTAQIGRVKMRRLMKEIKGMQSYGALPCRPEASIFIRVDEGRSDVFKFILSGPSDTPYSLGLFEFHMFCPNSFPDAPPLVNLITTGNGMVRFHPNLYSDGKVCLSLLGTWHASSEIEKWHKDRSTLLQILISIQVCAPP
jgi:ubiquitin-protein ligase